MDETKKGEYSWAEQLSDKKVKRPAPFSSDRHRQVITWERASLLTIKGYSAQYSLAWQIFPSIHPRPAVDELHLTKEARHWPRAKWAHICTLHIQKCHRSSRKCQNARTPNCTNTHRENVLSVFSYTCSHATRTDKQNVSPHQTLWMTERAQLPQ